MTPEKKSVDVRTRWIQSLNSLGIVRSSLSSGYHSLVFFLSLHLTSPSNARYTQPVRSRPLWCSILNRPGKLIARARREGSVSRCSQLSLSNRSDLNTGGSEVHSNQAVPTEDEVVRLDVTPHDPKAVQSHQHLEQSKITKSKRGLPTIRTSPF